MSLLRVETPRDELLVIFDYVSCRRHLAQLQTASHLLNQRVKYAYRLLRVGDDGLVVRLHLGQKMAFEPVIHRELHHLGIYHDELQLRRMLAVEQRGDDGIQTHRFTLSRRSRNQQVGHLRKIERIVLVLNRAADNHGQLGLRPLELLRADGRVHRHDLLVTVGHLDTDRTTARDRGYDTYTQRFETLCDILLQTLNLRYLHALRLHDLIERDRRAHRGVYVYYRNAEIFERLLDTALVVIYLGIAHLLRRLVILQKRRIGLAVMLQIAQRIIEILLHILLPDLTHRILVNLNHDAALPLRRFRIRRPRSIFPDSIRWMFPCLSRGIYDVRSHIRFFIRSDMPAIIVSRRIGCRARYDSESVLIRRGRTLVRLFGRQQCININLVGHSASVGDNDEAILVGFGKSHTLQLRATVGILIRIVFSHRRILLHILRITLLLVGLVTHKLCRRICRSLVRIRPHHQRRFHPRLYG